MSTTGESASDVTSAWAAPNLDQVQGPSEKDKAAYAFSDAGDYVLGMDSVAQPGVPKGTLTKWQCERSTVYPGVRHAYWLYVPQQYDPGEGAGLMCFLDGSSFLEERINVPAVLDNLIDKRQIPVMLGLFIDPGDNGPGLPLWGGSDNRSVEYDSMNGAYARFLAEDLIPRITAVYNVSSDPESCAVAGISSGGVGAFTAAWERPDVFRRVISLVGSFVDIRGANRYPSLVRRCEKKPIRVFLQSGSKDLDVIFGSWPVGNKDLALALAYRQYEYEFVFGDGGHSAKHGAAIFPDAMRWLWRANT
jgi:enterochelin esterase-like enzyme